MAEYVERFKLTHLIIAFGIMNDGKFALHDPYAFNETGLSAQLQRLRSAQPGVQIGISIGGWNHREQLMDIMENPEIFIRTLTQFAVESYFDFIDLDWEFEGEGEAEAMAKALNDFVKALHQTMPINKYLTMAMQPHRFNLHRIKIETLDLYVRYFLIMTYNLSGSWSACAHGFSSLYGPASVDETVKHFSRWIRQDKLAIGVSGNGIMFEGCSGPRQTFKTAVDFTGGEIPTGLQPVWDEQEQMVNLKGSDGTLISVESPRSLDAKVAYVEYNRLAGLFIWDIYQFAHTMSYAYHT